MHASLLGVGDALLLIDEEEGEADSSYRAVVVALEAEPDGELVVTMRRLEEEIRRRIDVGVVRLLRREVRPPLAEGDAIVFWEEEEGGRPRWRNGRIVALAPDGDDAQVALLDTTTVRGASLEAIHATHAALPVGALSSPPRGAWWRSEPATAVVVVIHSPSSQEEEHDGYACEIGDEDDCDWFADLDRLDLLPAATPPDNHKVRKRKRKRAPPSLQARLDREGLDARATVSFEFQPALVRARRDMVLKRLPSPPQAPEQEEDDWYTHVAPHLWTSSSSSSRP
jgi:hypothetical protein